MIAVSAWKCDLPTIATRRKLGDLGRIAAAIHLDRSRPSGVPPILAGTFGWNLYSDFKNLVYSFDASVRDTNRSASGPADGASAIADDRARPVAVRYSHDGPDTRSPRRCRPTRHQDRVLDNSTPMPRRVLAGSGAVDLSTEVDPSTAVEAVQEFRRLDHRLRWVCPTLPRCPVTEAHSVRFLQIRSPRHHLRSHRALVRLRRVRFWPLRPTALRSGAYDNPNVYGPPVGSPQLGSPYPSTIYPSATPSTLFPNGLFDGGTSAMTAPMYSAFRLFQGPRFRYTFIGQRQ